jgi:DNA polymerase III delta prime subunit
MRDIKERAMQICKNEKLKIGDQQLERIIEASGQDIRQIINMLQMWKN